MGALAGRKSYASRAFLNGVTARARNDEWYGYLLFRIDSETPRRFNISRSASNSESLPDTTVCRGRLITDISIELFPSSSRNWRARSKSHEIAAIAPGCSID